MRVIYWLLIISVLLFGFMVPTMAATDSSTPLTQNSVTGFVVPIAEMSLDYEHSLNESSAINVTWCTFPILSIVGGVFSGGNADYNLNIIDLSYKHYFNGAQNSLYFGGNLMFQQDDITIKNTGNTSTKYACALGASVGYRKITTSGFTYDLGATLYLPSNLIGDDDVIGGFYRLNIGYGW